MEASTVVATMDGPPEAEAAKSTGELFRWSGYVDVGRDAETCEHAHDGSCADPQHFHAWVCLPNTFQIRDIADKARAAKARKARALRDKNCDSFEVLELELDELRRDHYEELLRSLAMAEVEKRMVDIVRDIRENDERFEHHSQDFEELQRLRELPEEQRDGEELERLEADMLAYGEAMQQRVDSEAEKDYERLKQMPPDAVVEIERRARIDNVGTEAYLHTYYTWCMYIGTREVGEAQFTSKRKFPEPDALRNAAPEVVMALREKIRDLENATAARSDAAGNS